MPLTAHWPAGSATAASVSGWASGSAASSPRYQARWLVRCARDFPPRGPGPRARQAARASFEPLLGHDLGGVRIHDDAAGAGLAGSLGARAATLGSHIVFGAGQYEPRAPSGRHLLAHELAHAVQMGHLSPSLAAPYTAPDSALERDADASATLSAQGLPAAPRARAHAPVIARVPDGIKTKEEREAEAYNRKRATEALSSLSWSGIKRACMRG